jgi:tRNA(Ile)-lysidine synthase
MRRIELNLREKIFAQLDKLLLQQEKTAAIAVAISGGSDSTALALLALEWGEIHSVAVALLTVDHGLRSESKKEAENLQQKFCARGVDLHILRDEKQQRLDNNLQAHARNLRYSLMLNWCKENNFAALLLGHTQDDQAETVVMRLLRRSGVKGLSAMHEIRVQENIRLVRPLLAISRRDLRQWLQAKNEDWFEDPSNQNISFQRVAIRKWLEAAPDKDLMNIRLAQSAFYFQKLQDFFSQNNEEIFKKYVCWNEGGFCFIAEEFFTQSAEILQHNFLIEIINRLIPNSGELRAQSLSALLAEIKQCLQENSNAAYSMAGLLWYVGKFQGKIGVWCSRELERIERALQILPDESVIWDQRFICKLSALDKQKYGDEWRVTGLTYALLNEISQHDKNLQKLLKKIPKRAFLGVPVLMHLEIVESAPHIGYTNSSFSGIFVSEIMRR